MCARRKTTSPSALKPARQSTGPSTVRRAASSATPPWLRSWALPRFRTADMPGEQAHLAIRREAAVHEKPLLTVIPVADIARPRSRKEGGAPIGLPSADGAVIAPSRHPVSTSWPSTRRSSATSSGRCDLTADGTTALPGSAARRVILCRIPGTQVHLRAAGKPVPHQEFRLGQIIAAHWGSSTRLAIQADRSLSRMGLCRALCVQMPFAWYPAAPRT